MKKRILVLLLLFSNLGFALGDETVSENDLKAAFIFHFIGFTQWQDNQPEYNVCIPEDNDLRNVAQQAIEGKTINGRTINVVDRYDNCHVLVSEQIPSTAYVLTIGPLVHGSLMEFRVVANKLRFAVNMEKLKGSKLKISSQLLKLAILENA